MEKLDLLIVPVLVYASEAVPVGTALELSAVAVVKQCICTYTYTYIGDQCILKCLTTWLVLAESKTSFNTSTVTEHGQNLLYNCILKCLTTWLVLAESKTTSIAVGGAMAGLLVLIVVAIVLMLVARLHQQWRKKKKLTNLQMDIIEV